MKVRVRDLLDAPHMAGGPYWPRMRGQWITVEGPPIRRGSPEWRELELDAEMRERGCDGNFLWPVSGKEVLALCKVPRDEMEARGLTEDDYTAWMCVHELEVD